MGKPNIQFLTYLYALYAPSLLDLIQTFANPLTEGNITKGRPLDGTNRNMTYFASQTSRNKQGEWTSITDFDEYTTPIYDSDLENDWADSVAVDSVDEDTVAADDYDCETDTVYADTADWDSTLEETDRIAHTHTETRIGKDSWPTEIDKTIALDDKGVAWIYRRKLRKVQETQDKK